MSGPSKRSVEFVVDQLHERTALCVGADECMARRYALAIGGMLYDPALGLDRSVCLRDVVETIRASKITTYAEAALYADLLIREFGTVQPDGQRQ